MLLPRYPRRVTRRLSVRARMSPRTAPRVHVLALALVALCSVAPTAGAQAPPPDYASFDRDQDADYTPVAANLLRIWMVYVDQGDGLLIQLPPSCNYGPGQSERLDILIDGGSNPDSEAWRMEDFVRALYPNPRIEYAVITHHDSDHVAGLTYLLTETEIPVERIFHNGLATYRAGVRNFPETSKPANAVFKFDKGKLERGMAFLEPDGITMQAAYLVDDLAGLRLRYDNGELGAVYEPLAAAICTRPASNAVLRFDRARVGAPFIGEAEAALNRSSLGSVRFEVVWPPPTCRKFGDWGETINGNSVVFRLTYGEFSMLFTGDMNELSEAAILADLDTPSEREKLACDVLKVPHHGSSHGVEGFFTAAHPVVSVASMGEQGFRSKKVSGNTSWQHPSTDVIEWLGGAHRVYCTEIHEKPFSWIDLTSKARVEAMKEYTHILVETDGKRFRLVEVDDDRTDLIANPPSVQQSIRSDGTRWIDAVDGAGG